MKRSFLLLAGLLVAFHLTAEEITLATYNIEYFDKHFVAHRLSTNTITKEGAAKELFDEWRGLGWIRLERFSSKEVRPHPGQSWIHFSPRLRPQPQERETR
jgi:hypothetical protein